MFPYYDRGNVARGKYNINGSTKVRKVIWIANRNILFHDTSKNSLKIYSTSVSFTPPKNVTNDNSI
jgi:hypothetical protein